MNNNCLTDQWLTDTRRYADMKVIVISIATAELKNSDILLRYSTFLAGEFQLVDNNEF